MVKQTLAYVLGLMIAVIYAIQPIADISELMIGARELALGGCAMTSYAAPSAMNRNPAVIGSVLGAQFHITQFQIEQELNNVFYQINVPILGFPIGLTYQSQMLKGIPLTDMVNGRIRTIGVFDSGYQQYGFSTGTFLPKLMTFQDVALGIRYLYHQQRIASDTLIMNSIDAGIIMRPEILPLLTLGASIKNIGAGDLLPASIILGGSIQAAPFQFYYEKQDQIAMGAAFTLTDQLEMRMGFQPNFYSVGIGLRIGPFSAVGDYRLTTAIDYAYRMPIKTDSLDAQHIFTFSVLEGRKPNAPVIRNYELNKKANKVVINGYAQPRSDLTLFQNNQAIAFVQTNEQGVWSETFSLKNGKNNFKARVIILGNESEDSDEIVIENDYRNFSYTYRLSSYLNHELIVSCNQPVKNIKLVHQSGTISPQLRPQDENKNTYYFKLPMDFNSVKLLITDSIDQQIIQDIHRTIHITMPDKLNSFSYKNTEFIQGNAIKNSEIFYHKRQLESLLSGPTRVIEVNRFTEGGFKGIVELNDIRNDITIQCITPEGNAEELRLVIYKLHKYQNVDDIRFNEMATLGMLPMTASYHPEEKMSVGEFIHLLVVMDEEKKNSDSSYKILKFRNIDEKHPFYPDIKLAFSKGWLQAAPDFSIDSPLTLNTFLRLIFEYFNYGEDTEEDSGIPFLRTRKAAELRDYARFLRQLLALNLMIIPTYSPTYMMDRGEVMYFLLKNRRLDRFLEKAFPY